MAKWIICSNCEGDGHCLPESLRGEHRAEEWDSEDLDTLVSGGYDIPCTICAGTGKVQALNWFVQLYEVDRAYGGSEEGGWWYDTGEPVECYLNRGFSTFKAAGAYLFNLEEDGEADFLADWNAGRAPIHSVNCSGIFKFEIVQSPLAYPAERPRYE